MIFEAGILRVGCRKGAATDKNRIHQGCGRGGRHITVIASVQEITKKRLWSVEWLRAPVLIRARTIVCGLFDSDNDERIQSSNITVGGLRLPDFKKCKRDRSRNLAEDFNS